MRRYLARWAGPVLIAAAATVMAAWTWNTWPDLLIDFGRERYVPWRLAEGEVLFRDLAVHNGPLSQYFNALWFRLFGSGIRTIVLCNLALVALFLALLYGALRQIGRRWVATAACLVFVIVFAFAQHLSIGNFNYVCPYSHEMTHGVMLSLLAMVLAWPSPKGGALRWAGSGFVLGLAFLTKAEVFLPGAAATAAVLLLRLWFERPGWGRGLGRLGCFAAAFVLPPAVAFLLLWSAMPAREAWLGTLGTWGVAVCRDVVNLPFYKYGLGIDHPWKKAWAMLAMTGVYAAVLVPAAVAAFLLPWRPHRGGSRSPAGRTAMAVAVFAAAVLPLWWWRDGIVESAGKPLPLLVLLTLVAVVIGFLPRRRRPAAQRRFIRQISLLVFAEVLLAKMILNARLGQYGFVLAMPATMVLCVAALDWLPRWIRRRGGYGGAMAAGALALLCVVALGLLHVQAGLIARKTQRVGAGADAFWADPPRGRAVNAMAAEIVARSPPGTTLAVLPEGVILNWLSGLRSPTPYFNLTVLELLIFDERRIVEAYRAHPPDLVALVHYDRGDLGFRFFGRNYGQPLADWVYANYRLVAQVGDQPYQDQRFGIQLFESKQRLRGAAPAVKGLDATAQVSIGSALASQGWLDEAMRRYRQALDLDPHCADAHNNLGLALAGRARFEEAIDHYRQAVHLKPGFLGAHYNLARILAERGALDEAVAEYRYALKIDPRSAGVLNGLAWLLATSRAADYRNGAEAVELARRADRLCGGAQPEVLRTLSAAYAEAGRFPEALAAARQALDLARQQNNGGLAESLQPMIDLYEAGKPFRRP